MSSVLPSSSREEGGSLAIRVVDDDEVEADDHGDHCHQCISVPSRSAECCQSARVQASEGVALGSQTDKLNAPLLKLSTSRKGM